MPAQNWQQRTRWRCRLRHTCEAKVRFRAPTLSQHRESQATDEFLPANWERSSPKWLEDLSPTRLSVFSAWQATALTVHLSDRIRLRPAGLSVKWRVSIRTCSMPLCALLFEAPGRLAPLHRFYERAARRPAIAPPEASGTCSKTRAIFRLGWKLEPAS